jgi:hypothetical protein
MKLMVVGAEQGDLLVPAAKHFLVLGIVEHDVPGAKTDDVRAFLDLETTDPGPRERDARVGPLLVQGGLEEHQLFSLAGTGVFPLDKFLLLSEDDFVTEASA